jgi:LPXTG-motif cell wall-anchored protein
MKKLAAALVVAVALITGTAGIAAAYPPGVASLVLSPATVAPGGTFTATLNGCATGEIATFSVGSSTATDTCASPGVATLTAPTAPGTYTVSAVSPSARATATLTVAAPAAAGGGSAALPSTGSDSAPIAQIALIVLAAGLGLAGVAWFRRRSSTPA